jgi:hypothetical protein
LGIGEPSALIKLQQTLGVINTVDDQPSAPVLFDSYKDIIDMQNRIEFDKP